MCCELFRVVNKVKKLFVFMYDFNHRDIMYKRNLTNKDIEQSNNETHNSTQNNSLYVHCCCKVCVLSIAF